MKRWIVAGAILTALGAGLAGSAGARLETTRPGVLYVVNVIVKDKSVNVTHARYLRGAVIRYAVFNRGTKPYAFEVWGNATAPIAPGRKDTILVNWNTRGRFLYRTLYKKRPAGPKGYIVIF